MKDKGRTSGVGRRRILGGVGASGLAAAVAVFGQSSPAAADNYGCCNLIRNPPNISHATCTTSSTTLSYYNWSCNRNGYKCQCCEQYVYGVYFVGSGAKC